MDQVLAIARDTTTLLMPLFLVGCLVAVFFVIALLIKINRVAGHVQETTFLVNNVIHSSLFNVTSFISGLFDGKKK